MWRRHHDVVHKYRYDDHQQHRVAIHERIYQTDNVRTVETATVKNQLIRRFYVGNHYAWNVTTQSIIHYEYLPIHTDHKYRNIDNGEIMNNKDWNNFVFHFSN